MKTRVAVYEEGLFDLRGVNIFKGGKCPLLLPPIRNPDNSPKIVVFKEKLAASGGIGTNNHFLDNTHQLSY